MRWVDEYIDAWRAEDPQGVERLFTEDARYRRSPYEKSAVGHDAIKAFWLADAGASFAVRAVPVAVDGHAAVVRLDVSYGDPTPQEYRDLWVLQFADDGRVSDFEEWPIGPASRTRPMKNKGSDSPICLWIWAVEILRDDLFEDRLIRGGVRKQCH